MNPINDTHLSAEQVDSLLFDAAPVSDIAARHLRFCPACAAEIARLRSSIGNLHDALTSHAQTQRAHYNAATSLLRVRTERGMRPIPRVPAYFALAASAAIAIALFPFGRTPSVAPAPAHAVTAPAVSVESDEALLKEIDQQVSESVPSALEPLAELDTANTTSTRSNLMSNSISIEHTDKKD